MKSETKIQPEKIGEVTKEQVAEYLRKNTEAAKELNQVLMQESVAILTGKIIDAKRLLIADKEALQILCKSNGVKYPFGNGSKKSKK